MSFPKAELKRFNENTGCAPPVGAYDPKDDKKASGFVIEKSDRFKHPKDVGPGPGQDSTMFLSNPRHSSTPIKGGVRSSNGSLSSESSSHSTVNKSIAKKPAQANENLARVKELELEVRRLLREKNDKDKELRRLQQEQERLESRLTSANVERTACLARSAQLEHDSREAKRGLEVLQKQIAYAETAGKRKEDKHKDELHSLQQQIQSKEREIQSTQKLIVQALVTLVSDAEECAKYTFGLNTLLHKLDIPLDSVQSEDEDKGGTSGLETGSKQIDAQIKKARRLIKRVWGYVAKLAEPGIDKVEAMQNRLQEEHNSRLQHLASQLAEAQLRHQQLQQQLTQQQQNLQHKDRLAESCRERQEECEQLKLKITQLLHDSEQVRQMRQDYDTMQLRLQQAQEEQQSVQSQMQQEREALESKLQEECTRLELELRQTHEQMEQQRQQMQREQEAWQSKLQEERARWEVELRQTCEQAEKQRQQMQQEQQSMQPDQEALQSKLQEARAQWELELRQSREQAEQQAQEKLGAIQEELQQKEATLAELEGSLRQKQTEHEAAMQALQKELHGVAEKLTQAEKSLLHKQVQHEETLMQLQQALEDNSKVQEQLDHSQDSRIRMQQQIHDLQQEQERLRQLVTSLQQSRDNLEAESDLAKKELEVKGYLLSDALESLKGEVFMESETGTPTKAKQLLFEEVAERAALEEHMSQLDEENKILNLSIRTLTDKYKNIVQGLETDLMLEKDTSHQMQMRFTVSEQERHKTVEELERTQLVNKDLVQSLSLFEDELTRLKNIDQENKKEMEDLRKINTELQGTIKNLSLKLEEEHHASDSAQREAKAQFQQLEVQIRQHQIANEALQEKLGQVTEAFTKETMELKDKCQSVSQEKQRLVDKHKEDLQNVRRALVLDRENTNEQMEELNLQMERAQTFNCQMKEELKKLLKDKEKLKHDSHMEITALQEKVQTKEAQAEEASNQSVALHQQLQDNQQEVTRLKDTVTDLKQSVARQTEELVYQEQTLSNCRSRLAEQEEKLKEMQREKQALEDHVNRVSEERSMVEMDLEKQLSSLQEAALEERADFERIISEMSEKIQQLEEQRDNSEETEQWRQKYEALFARVEPFMVQLDAFAAERNLLVGRNQMAEAEMAKMMDKYAKLLGHQNQKQKIQYISKLKDEYMQCRKEKEALKEKLTKQQQTIQRLEKKIHSLEGKKTFDPLQAFKHVVNNEDTPRSPLKQTNK